MSDVSVQSQLAAAMDLHKGGRLDEAQRLYRAVLKSEPENAHALHLLGVLEAQRGELNAAVDLIGRSIELDATNPLAHYNLGNASRELHRLDEALASYDRALAILPAHAEALSNRAKVLHDFGRLDEALASYDRLIAARPDHAEGYCDRGLILHELKRFHDALGNFDFAIKLKRDYALAFYNRGVTLKEIRRLEESLANFNQAVALRPDDASALYNRGAVLREMSRLDEALSDYDRAFALTPDMPCLEGWRVHLKLQMCEWAMLAADLERLEKHLQQGVSAAAPFVLVTTSSSPEAQLVCARQFLDPQPVNSAPAGRGARHDHARIRVGYVSGEFRNHVTAHFIAGVLEHHDRRAFEVHAFATGLDDASAIRRRVETACDVFRDASAEPDGAFARMISRSELDILIDLNGLAGDRRTGVFALRPSPVQVNYFGYPGTMGASFIDYIIADKILIPESAQRHYSEKVAYLPDCYQPNDAVRTVSGRKYSRADCGLPQRGFVFACFNSTYKILPEVFDVWMRILKRVPGSVLWLLETNATGKQNLGREAELRGIAAERIVFAPVLGLPDHLARTPLADLFLDTFPCNAHTTASDSLWCGVPILTTLGTTFAGRVAASLLHAIGLPELIAGSLADYEELAVKLSRDATLFAAIKAKLARNHGTYPLFDLERYTRHLEAAFTTMLTRHHQGLPPESFVVDPI